jgi:hypothetical protein
MLGYHRPVPAAIGDWGKIRVINRAGLEQASCECYAIVSIAWLALGQNSFFRTPVKRSAERPLPR